MEAIKFVTLLHNYGALNSFDVAIHNALQVAIASRAVVDFPVTISSFHLLLRASV